MASEPLILSGAYRLLRRAGAGGTATVYLAERTDGSGQQVAVKVLKKALAEQPDMVERFKREAQLLARVDHPHVVRLLRFEVAPEGMLLVMEWAPGRRLDEELDRHTLLGIEKALVLRQLAAALQAVHALAIVHRDLKPENVMLDRTDTTVRARLLDFGIARVLGRRPGGQFVTATGTVAGTPSFLSPEQVLDRALDARSDVYSFGVLAYLLVSGRLPFTGASDVEVMQQQVKAAPPALTAVDPELEALIPVVLACLAKKPGGRPRDGAALGAALDAALRPAGDTKRRWFAR